MRIIPAITCRRLFATNVGPRNRSFGFADALQTTDEMSRAGCGVFSLKRFYSATRSTKCQSAGKTEKHGIVKVIGISRSVVRCRSSCATRCRTETSTICSQILSQNCSCGTILNSSTMSQLHNLLADPLQHSFPWDQLHHLNAFIQQLRLWHMLDGFVVALISVGTRTTSTVSSDSEALANARQSVALVPVGPASPPSARLPRFPS